MIDFKYYLVSITAIIAALVAGVIIGTALNTSHELQIQQQKLVESIQEDISQLRAELEEKNQTIKEYEKALSELNAWIADSRLSGKNIAVVYTAEHTRSIRQIDNELKQAGADTLLVRIEVSSSTTETTTVFDYLSDVLFSPDLTREKLDAVTGVVSSSGNYSQVQELVVFASEEMFNAYSEELAEMAASGISPVFCLDNYDLAVKLFSYSDRKASCVVYDGDVFDNIALILAFDAKPSISGILDRNANPVPESEQ